MIDTNQKLENIRSEYAAVVEYHSSTVGSRFTIAGLYVAAIGFIASAVLDKDASWIARAGGSLLAWWLTVCLWVLELRSRALYTNLAHRGIEIEHRIWSLVGREWYAGFFSRQYKEKPSEIEDKKDVPEKPGMDRPKISWMKKPLSEKISGFISHSWGFDLLYTGSLVFWSGILLVSLYFVSFSSDAAGLPTNSTSTVSEQTAVEKVLNNYLVQCQVNC